MIRYLFISLLLGAQPAPIMPPIEGRPEDFSNIAGDYAIEASAVPLEVAVNEPITLQVRIIGTGPAQFEPRRKDLHILPDWERLFYVEPVPDEDRVLKDKKTWLFVYRLRPKHVHVTAIDEIKLVYFDTTSREYATRYANRISNIMVKPAPDPSTEIVSAIEAPDSFWRIEESHGVLTGADPAFAPSLSHIALALLLPPIACFLGVLAWRRWNPDESRERNRQRRQAAQTAFANLRSNRAFAWDIVRQYLCDRFDFDVDDPTPDDVADFLKRRGFARDHCALGLAFFQSCDAIRFAPGAIAQQPLADEATRLIEALEADPCAR